jgi:hypothetical protein
VVVEELADIQYYSAFKRKIGSEEFTSCSTVDQPFNAQGIANLFPVTLSVYRNSINQTSQKIQYFQFAGFF